MNDIILFKAEFKNNNKTKFLSDVNFGLSSRSLSTDDFPEEFSLNLGNNFGKNFDQKFIKISKSSSSNPIDTSDIYEYSKKARKTLKYVSKDKTVKIS